MSQYSSSSQVSSARLGSPAGSDASEAGVSGVLPAAPASLSVVPGKSRWYACTRAHMGACEQPARSHGTLHASQQPPPLVGETRLHSSR